MYMIVMYIFYFKDIYKAKLKLVNFFWFYYV
jgi:hypothetical protein